VEAPGADRHGDRAHHGRPQNPREALITLVDGPLGSLLADHGVATPAPLWSAAALLEAPGVVRRLHQAYAAAGATVHTANTFRTKPRQAGAPWETLTRLAVQLARESVPPAHLVAGSLAPLEDCYRPDLSPRDPRPEHRAMARGLAAAGVDLILCETFPHVGEALVAVEEAAATGLPVWLSFTAGPDGSLLSPQQVEEGARAAASRGASALLFNCTAAHLTLPYVERLEKAAAGAVPFGAYANAGSVQDGWGAGDEAAAPRYVAFARTWVACGATLVGSCCGTGPAHIAGLAQAFAPNVPLGPDASER
jgi:S-methylmethionine-dependent homocysteine/selenocysteine methylase